MVASTERRTARIDLAPEGEAEASIDDELLEQLVDRRRLRFPEPLESAFRDDYARRWVSTNRSAFWIGIVLYLALAALDLYAAPESGGQIGLRKFSYDLWGDTVNTASRMESHAAPGSIQVTDAVFGRLQETFRFGTPGTTDVKGKGPMRTYTLEGDARACVGRNRHL